MGLRATINSRAGRWAVVLGIALPVLVGAALAGFARYARADAGSGTDTVVQAKVTVCGVAVIGQGYETGSELLRAFHWRKGTTVVLLVNVPDGGVIAVNRDESKMTKMIDDKETDLTLSKSVVREPHVGRDVQVSADGKACVIEFYGQEVPAAGATSITASGTISLQCGTKKDLGKQEKVALKEGEEFTVGDVTFKVFKAGMGPRIYDLSKPVEGEPEKPPEDQFMVTLSSERDWADIASVKFLDDKGQDLGAKPGKVTSIKSRGKLVASVKTFILPVKVDTATIAISTWEDLKDIIVPFDVKATVSVQ